MFFFIILIFLINFVNIVLIVYKEKLKMLKKIVDWVKIGSSMLFELLISNICNIFWIKCYFKDFKLMCKCFWSNKNGKDYLYNYFNIFYVFFF